VDSPESPEQGGSSIGVTLVTSSPHQPTPPLSDLSTFEEIIDLSSLPSKPVKSSGPGGDNYINHGTGDVTLSVGVLDNGLMSGAGDNVPITKPIIAFEDNSTRQDVPGT